jgi:ferredoxin
MPITADKNLCIGCGACASICPDAFKINGEGKSEVISQDNIACAKSAAESCPTQAIKVI